MQSLLGKFGEQRIGSQQFCGNKKTPAKIPHSPFHFVNLYKQNKKSKCQKKQSLQY